MKKEERRRSENASGCTKLNYNNVHDCEQERGVNLRHVEISRAEY